MSTISPNRSRQRGFSIIAAIFILVVLAGLGGFIVSTTVTQSLSAGMDVQGMRAYQAARAGAEFGLARWLGTSPSLVANCNGVAMPVTLPAGDLSGFTVTMTPTLSTGGGKNFCTIVSTATTGAPLGSPGRVERQIRAVVEGL